MIIPEAAEGARVVVCFPVRLQSISVSNLGSCFIQSEKVIHTYGFSLFPEHEMCFFEVNHNVDAVFFPWNSEAGWLPSFKRNCFLQKSSLRLILDPSRGFHKSYAVALPGVMGPLLGIRLIPSSGNYVTAQLKLGLGCCSCSWLQGRFGSVLGFLVAYFCSCCSFGLPQVCPWVWGMFWGFKHLVGSGSVLLLERLEAALCYVSVGESSTHPCRYLRVQTGISRAGGCVESLPWCLCCCTERTRRERDGGS